MIIVVSEGGVDRSQAYCLAAATVAARLQPKALLKLHTVGQSVRADIVSAQPPMWEPKKEASNVGDT